MLPCWRAGIFNLNRTGGKKMRRALTGKEVFTRQKRPGCRRPGHERAHQTAQLCNTEARNLAKSTSVQRL